MSETSRVRIYPAAVLERPLPLRPKRPHQHLAPRPLPILLALLTLIVFFHLVAITHSAYPTVTIQNCLDLLRYTDYKKIFTGPTETVEDVQFLGQLSGTGPAVLVPVMQSASQPLLSVYIYGCESQKHHPELTLLFKQQALLQGEVEVTSINTLSISTSDPTLPPASLNTLEPLQEDISREYAWHNATFIQIPFPGLYPVTSRLEAEALQDQQDQAQNVPWADPIMTTAQMAKDLFHWQSTNMMVSLQDQDNTTAHVLLVQRIPYFAVSVTLQRLIEPGSGGLWFVTQAHTPGITLSQAQLQVPVTSPMQVQGTIIPSPGAITATIFDHTLAQIPLLNRAALTIQDNGIYQGQLFYTNNVPDQPGLLLIERPAPPGNSATGQLLLSNVLLN